MPVVVDLLRIAMMRQGRWHALQSIHILHSDVINRLPASIQEASRCMIRMCIEIGFRDSFYTLTSHDIRGRLLCNSDMAGRL